MPSGFNATVLRAAIATGDVSVIALLARRLLAIATDLDESTRIAGASTIDIAFELARARTAVPVAEVAVVALLPRIEATVSTGRNHNLRVGREVDKHLLARSGVGSRNGSTRVDSPGVETATPTGSNSETSCGNPHA
jgi:hypothetical protein